MPLYEYECEAAHHRFEMIRKFSDPPITSCPTCGSPVHKLFSSPAIQFKGSGFYITDYAKKESAPVGKTEGSKDGDAKGNDSAGSAKDEKSEKSEKSDKSVKSETTSKTEAPSAPAAATSDKSTSST
jgi:putative FmdB family regulatory protein